MTILAELPELWSHIEESLNAPVLPFGNSALISSNMVFSTCLLNIPFLYPQLFKMFKLFINLIVLVSGISADKKIKENSNTYS